jgi:hypothetical protein
MLSEERSIVFTVGKERYTDDQKHDYNSLYFTPEFTFPTSVVDLYLVDKVRGNKTQEKEIEYLFYGYQVG